MSFHPVSAASTAANYPYTRSKLVQHIDKLSYVPGLNCVVGAVRFTCSAAAVVVSTVAIVFAKLQIKRKPAEYTPILQRWKFVQLHSLFEYKHALMEILYVPILLINFDARFKAEMAMALLQTKGLSSQDQTAFKTLCTAAGPMPENTLSADGLSQTLSILARYQISLPDAMNESLVQRALTFKEQGSTQFDSFIYAFFERTSDSSLLRVLTARPTNLAICCQDGTINILEVFLKRSIPLDKYRSTLLPIIEKACQRNHSRVLQLLASHQRLLLTPVQAASLLRAACQAGYAGVVKHVLPLYNFPAYEVENELGLLCDCLVDPIFVQSKSSFSIVQMIQRHIEDIANREAINPAAFQTYYLTTLITAAHYNPELQPSFAPLIHFCITKGATLSSNRDLIKNLYEAQNTQLLSLLFAQSTKEDIAKLISHREFWSGPNSNINSLLDALRARDPSLLNTCAWYLSFNLLKHHLPAIAAAGGQITVDVLHSQQTVDVALFCNNLKRLPEEFRINGLSNGAKAFFENLAKLSRDFNNVKISPLPLLDDMLTNHLLSPLFPLISEMDEAILSSPKYLQSICDALMSSPQLLNAFLSRPLTAASTPLLCRLLKSQMLLPDEYRTVEVSKIIRTGLVSNSDCLATLLSLDPPAYEHQRKIGFLIDHNIGINVAAPSGQSPLELSYITESKVVHLRKALIKAGAQFFIPSPQITAEENTTLTHIAEYISSQVSALTLQQRQDIFQNLMNPVHAALTTLSLLGPDHPVRARHAEAIFGALSTHVYGADDLNIDNFQHTLNQTIARDANSPAYFRHLSVAPTRMALTPATRENAPELIVLGLEQINRLSVGFLTPDGEPGPEVDAGGPSRDLISGLRNLFDKRADRLIAMNPEGIPVYRTDKKHAPFATELTLADQDRFYHALGALFDFTSLCSQQNNPMPMGIILPNFYFALLSRFYPFASTVDATVFDSDDNTPNVMAQRFACLGAYAEARNLTILKERYRLASLADASPDDKMKFYLLSGNHTLEIDPQQLESMNFTNVLNKIAVVDNKEALTNEEMAREYATRLRQFRQTLDIFVDDETDESLLPEDFVNAVNTKQATVKDLLDKLDLEQLPKKASGPVLDLIIALARLKSAPPQGKPEDPDEIKLHNKLLTWLQENLPADTLQDAMVKQTWGTYQNVIRPALRITQGMVQASTKRQHVDLPDLIEPTGVKLAEAIQGLSISPKEMIKEQYLSHAGVPPHIVTWFKNFVLQNDEECAADLLFALTGQRTLTPGMRITLMMSNEFMAHTCSRSLEINRRYTKQVFESSLYRLVAKAKSDQGFGER